MMLATQYHFRTREGLDSSYNDSYTLFLTEDLMLSVAGFSYTGRRRQRNEDNYLLQDGTLVVVDGMGGHTLGEIASELVCDTFEAQQNPTSVPTIHWELSDTFREAHTRLIQESRRRPKQQGKKDDLGAAAVALRFRADTLASANIGDSRIYRLRNNTLEQITDDDTPLWEKYRAGKISKESIRTSEGRNYLNRALGFEGDTLADLQDTYEKVLLGDIYLLCTDGLWEELSDDLIKQIITQGYRDHPDDDLAIAQMLVTAANDAGGRDNITAVVARVKGVPVEVLVERAMGAIEENDSSLLRHVFDKYEMRLKFANGSKARYVLAEHTSRNVPDLMHTARDLYLEAIQRATPEEQEEPYFGKSIDALLRIYTTLYVRDAGTLNGKEKTFFSKMLELRARAGQYKERVDTWLADTVDLIGDRVVPTYKDAPTLLAGIHSIVDAQLPHIPTLATSFIELYNKLAQKALETKDYTAAHDFVKKGGVQPIVEDTSRTAALGRRDALVVEIARGYFEDGDTQRLGVLVAQEKVPATFYDWGKEAFSKRNFDAAAAAFSAVVQQEPRNSWAHYYLGRTYHALARTAPAEDAFMRTVALKPEFVTQDYQEALDYIAAKDYRRAGWAIERAVEIASYCDTAPKEKILETLTTLGVLYKEGKEVAKDHATARRLFTAALSLAPDYVHADYHLGTLAFMERDFLSAEQHLNRVVRQNPKHRWAHYQLGRVLEMTGNSEAQNHYHIAADLGLVEAQSALKQVKQ